MRLWVGSAVSLMLLVACSGDPAGDASPRRASPSESNASAPSQAPVDLTAGALQEAVEQALPASSIGLAEKVPLPRSTEIGYGTNPQDPDWSAEGFPRDGIVGSVHTTFAMPTTQRDAVVYVNLFVVDHPPDTDLCGVPWDRDRTGDPCEIAHERGRTVVTQTYTNLIEYYVVMPGFVVSALAATKDGTPIERRVPISRTAVGNLAHGVVDELVQ